MIMETKEFEFKGTKVSGFIGLLLLYSYLMRTCPAGAQRSPCNGVLW